MADPQLRRLEPEGFSLFLRQQRLKDQLRRLRNDFNNCHCPPGCRGGPLDHLIDPVDPESPPAQPTRGPHVPADRDCPTTWARPYFFRVNGQQQPSVVVAEARGTSDILLRKERDRATLRMSMQVRTDSTNAGGRLGYFGEMFLTRHGQPEEFIGFISSWYMDRQGQQWEETYLDAWSDEDLHGRYAGTDMEEQRNFFQHIYGIMEDERARDENHTALPIEYYRNHIGSLWARLHEDIDIVYMPMIWIHNEVCTVLLHLQPPPPTFPGIHHSFSHITPIRLFP
jgi:hypothetical protein